MKIKNEGYQNDFFLLSNGKGFCLQRLKKKDFTTHMKTKAKSNHTKPLNPVGGETLPGLREESVSSILQNDGTQKMKRNRQIKSVCLDSFGKRERSLNRKQNCNQEKNQMRRTLFKVIDPKFPEIEQKKLSRNVKSFRTIQQNDREESVKPKESERPKIFKTKKAETKRNIIEDQINFLIQQEALRIEFLEGQTFAERKLSFYTIQNNKRQSPKKIKKKRPQEIIPQQTIIEKYVSEKQLMFVGPKVRSFNPTQIKPNEVSNTKCKQQWTRYQPNRLQFKKQSLPLYPHKQIGNRVQGWVNQNRSNDSEQLEHKDEWIDLEYQNSFYASERTL